MSEPEFASRWSASTPTRSVRAVPGTRLAGRARHLGPALCVAFATWLGGCGVHAADAARTRELVALLQSPGSSLADRARACQQLAIVGTAEAVPPLAALLADDKLAHYAREVLEVMPDPAAAAALRGALARLEGPRLIGVINSVGARRDAGAVPALTNLARSGAPPVAHAALRALGRIATPDARQLLQGLLAHASEPTRTAAAEALLDAADRSENAEALYEAVRRAELPVAVRAAATRGAILVRREGALPLLAEQLRSSEEAFRHIGIRCVRELSPDALPPRAFLPELDRLPAPLQALLIAALADRRDAAAYLGALEARAGDDDEVVRLAALQALGKIGGDSTVPVVLRATTGPEGPGQNAAWAALARMRAPGVDAALLDALGAAPPARRVRLIAVLSERNAGSATPALFAQAAAPEPEVRAAAWRALAIVARPADLPELLRRAATARDEAERTLADRAIVTTSMKVLEPARRADAVLAAFREAPDAATKAALLRPLGAIVRAMGGSHEVFFAIRPALQDPAEAVRAAALKVLADWPDATPTTALLEVANRADASAAAHEVALAGAIRMATSVASGRERSPLNVVAAFTDANRAVRTRGEKLMIVSGLGNLRRAEAVALLQPYLEDDDVRAEAALALVQIAPALANTPHAATLRPLLERVAAREADEDVRRKAARLAQGGPVDSAKSKAKGKAKSAPAAPPASAPGQLFNGADLAGWEGDPGVWRVHEGVIVGGSLEGNPRNEFLATTRSHRNFVLRLDYKLTGTEGFVNGGVQFRSVRMAQPPNEMSGYQADIGAGHSGSLYDETRRRKFLARAAEEQVRRLEKPGDWNRYEIRCEGARIELWLNGEKTVAYQEQADGIAPAGLIALQIHGNCKAEIRFRNVALQELP